MSGSYLLGDLSPIQLVRLVALSFELKVLLLSVANFWGIGKHRRRIGIDATLRFAIALAVRVFSPRRSQAGLVHWQSVDRAKCTGKQVY